MSEITTRLNLIQRAMQRGALAREPVSADEHLLQQSTDRASGLTPEQTSGITPQIRLEPAPEPGFRAAQPVHLDHANLRASRIATAEDKTSATYSEFRSLKRKLLAMARNSETGGMERNVIMVTSALPREGKTFTVMNLAICLAAEHNLNVILVDGDVVRGSIGHYFNGEERSGLIELLTGKRQRIEDVLHPCANLPGLHVLLRASTIMPRPNCSPVPRWTTSATSCRSASRMALSCSIRPRCWPRLNPPPSRPTPII